MLSSWGLLFLSCCLPPACPHLCRLHKHLKEAVNVSLAESKGRFYLSLSLTKTRAGHTLLCLFLYILPVRLSAKVCVHAANPHRLCILFPLNFIFLCSFDLSGDRSRPRCSCRLFVSVYIFLSLFSCMLLNPATDHARSCSSMLLGAVVDKKKTKHLCVCLCG